MTSSITPGSSIPIRSVLPEDLQCKEEAWNKANLLKNLGISIGAGVLEGFIGENIANLVTTSTIPNFNFQKMMTDTCIIIKKNNYQFSTCFEAPIVEEFLHRYCIQEILLTRIPKMNMSGKETILDSKIAKVARIFLTSAYFAFTHLSNAEILPDSYVTTQIIEVFLGGICLGVLKESRVGLLGCIIAHMANNILATIEVTSYC